MLARIRSQRLDVNYLAAQIIATIANFFLSYVLSSPWIFRKEKQSRFD